MSSGRNPDSISAEVYLVGEELSNVRHEYIAGVVHAMVGGTAAHSIISGNIFSSLRSQLKGSACRAFGADMKVRVQTTQGTRFCYPDAQVVCSPIDLSQSWQDAPVIVFEVVSDSSRRFDENEKKDSYLTIPSLSACVMFEQDSPKAGIHRRTKTGFERSAFEGFKDSVDLPEVSCVLPMADVYQDIER